MVGLSTSNNENMETVSLGGYSVVAPGKPLGIKGKEHDLDKLLDQYWNNLVSSDPDDRSRDVVYLRTSPNRNKPLRTNIVIKENQVLVVPWRTCEYDIDDTPGVNDINIWMQRAEEDMKAGDQPFSAIFTIDGHPIVENLASYFSAPHKFKLTIDRESSLKNELDVPFSDSPSKRDAVAAGYIVPLKLQARTHPYKIKIEANGKGGYLTKATYKVTVK